MSGVDRRRRWRLAPRTTVVAVMGGAKLDLRHAELEALETTLTIFAVMGGVDVIVPEGVNVEVTGIAVMGAKNENVSHAPARPGSPLIRIDVFAVMGGVNIRSRPAATVGRDGGQPALTR